jgi:uncharacterized cupredoxin-like copper-binding protein
MRVWRDADVAEMKEMIRIQKETDAAKTIVIEGTEAQNGAGKTMGVTWIRGSQVTTHFHQEGDEVRGHPSPRVR